MNLPGFSITQSTSRCFGILLLLCSLGLLSCGPGSPFDQTGTDVAYELKTKEVEEILTDSLHAAEDANGDGRVTLAEWKAANPSKDAEEFHRRDLNGNGAVSLGEFEQHVADNGTFNHILRELDPDGKGVVTNRDFDRFRKRHKLLE